MNTIAKSAIIQRTPGLGGVMWSDAKRVFSHLWQGSKEVIVALDALNNQTISPEEVSELFFEGGSGDPVFWCFVILVSQSHEDTLVLLRDLPSHNFDNVDEAHDWFYSNIFTTQKLCSGRNYFGRKKPRTAA